MFSKNVLAGHFGFPQTMIGECLWRGKSGFGEWLPWQKMNWADGEPATGANRLSGPQTAQAGILI
jgi:hypothetical protein